MEFDDLRETYDDFYAPRFELSVGGTTITRADGVVSGLRVDTALDRANRFSFTADGVFDLEAREFTDRVDDLETGTTVDVKMGYGAETRLLVRGKIDATDPSFPADGGPSMSVSGHDLLHGLSEGTGTGSWQETTLDSVVTELVQGVGFAGKTVEGSDVSFEQLSHPETSDYRFLRTLADDHGFECFSRAGEFQFREPGRDASPALTLRYGRALRSFEPSGDNTAPQVGTVKVKHWDEKNGETFVGEAEVAGGGDETRVHRIPVRSGEEAERRAKAKARKLANTGGHRGQTVGIPELQVGKVVKLTGLGEEYSGSYYVESANHRVGSSGYTTSFEVTEVNE